jgi:hypothetical protein
MLPSLLLKHAYRLLLCLVALSRLVWQGNTHTAHAPTWIWDPCAGDLWDLQLN